MPRDPSKIRCPKCLSRPTSYVEHWTAQAIVFDARSDGSAEPIGDLTEGEPCAVSAHCRCGYSWRLKGVRQITELRAKESEVPHA